MLTKLFNNPSRGSLTPECPQKWRLPIEKAGIKDYKFQVEKFRNGQKSLIENIDYYRKILLINQI